MSKFLVTSNVPSMSIGSGLGKFNFNTVTNQSSDVVMSVLEAGELNAAYDNYKAVFGVVPLVEEELTAEKIYRGLKVGVGASTWSEFFGEVMKSVRVLCLQGCRIQ